MSIRGSPESYFGVVDTSQPTQYPNQPVVNNYYTLPTQTQSLSTPEEELAQIKFLIIGLAIGLALGIAIYSMMRDRK